MSKDEISFATVEEVPTRPPSQRVGSRSARRQNSLPLVLDAEDNTPPQPQPKTWPKIVLAWLVAQRQSLGAYTLSTVLHTVVLLILATVILKQDNIAENLGFLTLSTTVDDDGLSEDEDLSEVLTVFEVENEADKAPVELIEPQPEKIELPDPAPGQKEQMPEPQSPLENNTDLSTAFKGLKAGDASGNNGTGRGVDFGSSVGGRSKAARKWLVALYGGTPASETAVERGLKWLAAHQQTNGSWSFQHHVNEKCVADCTIPGALTNCQMGATSMALLSFLGAGHTHHDGDYQGVVKRGIQYLTSNMKRTGDLRGNFISQGMYVQGLASIALCEAHAMTLSHFIRVEELLANGQQDEISEKDQRFYEQALQLRQAAQLSINFITIAQDKYGGGWRYQPGQPGDTSVVGWQLMALQSARAARLRVQPNVYVGVDHFLNGVQALRGSRYGYTSPAANSPSTTAIGLLCRMYLGWGRDKPALQAGVLALSEEGPSRSDMYYNYYATQVMHHWGGEPWQKWNSVLRDYLVGTQSRGTGHAFGSWTPFPGGRHNRSGGRVYETCLSIMTLEVYYRHLPLYDRELLATPKKTKAQKRKKLKRRGNKG